MKNLGQEKSIKLIALEMNEFYFEMVETLKNLRKNREKENKILDDDNASIISTESVQKFKTDDKVYNEYLKIKKLDEKILESKTLFKVTIF